MVTLEQTEYFVTNEEGSILVPIILSRVKPQDIEVEVAVTDGTATGM